MPKQVSNVASDDYLTAIYRLDHDEGQDVIAVRLADRLEITPPSVAGMLKRLLRDHLQGLLIGFNRPDIVALCHALIPLR